MTVDPPIRSLETDLAVLRPFDPDDAEALFELMGDAETMRFFGKVAVDEGFEGMALGEAEGERLAEVMGDKPILLMGNHGVLVAGPSVARAFDDLYYFEKACETLVTAYMTGKALRVCSDAVARETLRGWQSYPDFSERQFAALRRILDREDPDYKD